MPLSSAAPGGGSGRDSHEGGPGGVPWVVGIAGGRGVPPGWAQVPWRFISDAVRVGGSTRAVVLANPYYLFYYLF